MGSEVEMTPLEYLLPETIEEALKYLQSGVPLAGGTGLTPRRRELKTVVDLRKLGLDGIVSEDGWLKIGATATLQKIVEEEVNLPGKLREGCRLEFGWNMRNRATIGGMIIGSDGRSAILTTLLALDVQIMQQPGSVILPLDDLLDCRQDVKLITHIQFKEPSKLLYEQVSRAPADFPLVCAALAYWNKDGKERFVISVGGHGDRPLRLREAEAVLDDKKDIPSAVALARNVYAGAGDMWASAEYRSEVVGTLVHRLLREVIS
jgi:probable selenate reductase FAD-binding subunit